jgi:uncharacterized protein (DUF2164 family)
MTITISPESSELIIASIKRYVSENLDQDIGDLKAGSLLDYFLREIGPTVYNKAIADAQEYFQARTMDLEGVCFEKELSYWTVPAPRGRR